MLHDFKRCLSPFSFYKRRHVDARTVFGFQRTVVLSYNKRNDSVHKAFVTICLLRRIKRLVQNEVKISFQSVAVDGTIVVSKLFQQLLQLRNGFVQILRMECHVFYHRRSTGRTHGSYGRENTGTDIPQQRIFLFFVCKHYGMNGSKTVQIQRDVRNVFLQRFFVACGRFYEQGRSSFRQVFDKSRYAFFVFYGAQRLSVQHFHANDRQFSEGLNGSARFFCMGKICHGTGLKFRYRFCVDCDFRQESQCALGTGHKVCYDIKRVFEFHQREQV